MKDFLGYKDEYLSTKRGYNLLRLFSPLKCMFCGEVEFMDGGPFCSECYKEFLSATKCLCPYCNGEKEECECFKLSGVKAHYFNFWYHGEFVTEIVSMAKYGGDKRYIAFLGKLLAEEIQRRRGKIKFKGICYVPRSKSAIGKLGFDQSLLLAECVAFYTGLPVYTCLVRKNDGSEQKKLSGDERRRNIMQKFDINTSGLVDENGEIHQRLLLVDDVVTTGSTVQECSYILRKSGVSSVYVASVARTPFRKRRKLIKKTKKL